MKKGMTIEEAISALENIYGMLSEENKRALDVADGALAKQIGKKLIRRKKDELICPNCECVFFDFSNHYPHCPECGQKLDWSDEEGEENEID